MRRIGFWLVVIVTTVVLFSLAGLAAAVRWWPKQTIPHLPLQSLVLMHAVADTAGQSLIRNLLKEEHAHNFIVESLRRSGTAQQRHLIEIMAGRGYGSYSPPEQAKKLFADFTQHDDPRLRIAARRLLNPISRGLAWNGRHLDGNTGIDHSRALGPGSWKPNPTAVQALLALTYLGAGYDHLMPSKYSRRVATLISQLRSSQDEFGSFAANGCDHAIVTLALAEAYAMTNDPTLKQPAQMGIDHMLRAGDGGPEHRWSADSLQSCWDLAAQKSALVGGLRTELDHMEAWMRSNPDFGTVWREDGQQIPVDAQDLRARQALFSIFLDDRSMVMAMDPESLIPGPERSECIRMWLSLSLFMRSADFIRHTAENRDRLVNDQLWNPADPNFGCMAPGDAGAHAVRMFTVEIYYRVLW